MTLKELLIQWNRKPNAPKISVDSNGIYTVPIKDRYYLSFEESIDTKGFYIYSVVAKMNPEENLAWAVQALESNLFGKETGKNSLGFDSNTRALILFKYLSYNEINSQLFNDHIEEFIAYRNYWEKKIQQLTKGQNKKKQSMSQSLSESVSGKKVDIFFA